MQLELRMEIENNQLQIENNQLQRRTLELNRDISKLSRHTTTIALVSQRSAEETSRTTKASVQLLLVSDILHWHNVPR
jgi:hypothetical protein